jgi:hypothetical protein
MAGPWEKYGSQPDTQPDAPPADDGPWAKYKLPPGMRASGTAEELRPQLEWKEPGVDYSKGADINVRYNLFRASNPKEEEAYLSNKFGAGNYKKDKRENWLVKQDGKWTPVFPEGVLEGLKTGGAAVGAQAPEIGGGIAGGFAGAPLGPVGMAGGAALGAGSAAAMDEAAKKAQGFYSKTPGQLAGRIGSEAALAGGFESAGPLKSAIEKPLYGAASSALKKFSGATPESQMVTQSLERFPGRKTIFGKQLPLIPPLQSSAPDAYAFEYDRALRNQIAKDPMLAPRIAAMDARTKEVLQGFGMQGEELAQATAIIANKMAALSPVEAGKGMVAALKNREEIGAVAEAAARALPTARSAALKREEMTNRVAAEKAIESAYQQISTTASKDVGSLGSNVVAAFEQERATFNKTMNQAYGAIHKMAGGAEVVPTEVFAEQARQLTATMDPQAVPPIIRRWAEEEVTDPMTREVVKEGPPHMITIEEAHNLRTALREMAKIKDLSPIGQRRGNIRSMAGAVDDALYEASGNVGKNVGAALKEADDAYGQGIQRFTGAEMNALVRDVRNGRMPDAGVVADMLIDKDSVEATRQIWDLLPPELQSDVARTDLKNMIDSASTIGKDGRKTLNPTAWLKALDEREPMDFIYHPELIKSMRDLAYDAKALAGDLDVSALPPNPTRDMIQRAVGAQRALQEEVQYNGASAAKALRSDDPKLTAMGAHYFIAAKSGKIPPNELRTLGGMELVGKDSPAWKEVQKYAVQDLLKSAVVPKGLSRTVSGTAIEDYLSTLTLKQQSALFGDRLEDIKLIAQQAKALFPKAEEDISQSFAAGTMKRHLLSWQGARAQIYSRFIGRLADSTILTKMLAGQLRAKPYEGRAIVSYLMQGGADLAMSKLQRSGAQEAPQEDFSGLYGNIPKQKLPASFGDRPSGAYGPQE